MYSKKLASFLSVLLGPQIWLPVLFLAVMFNSGLSREQLTILLPTTLFLQVIVPLSYLYIAPKVGLATAWDLPLRKERYLFLTICLISFLISLICIYYYGSFYLFSLNLLLLAPFILIFLITLYWKISLHTSLNTAGSILLNFLYGWNLWWLYPTIPIIFWARLVLKKHTISQLFAGILISAALILIGVQFI